MWFPTCHSMHFPMKRYVRFREILITRAACGESYKKSGICCVRLMSLRTNCGKIPFSLLFSPKQPMPFLPLGIPAPEIFHTIPWLVGNPAPHRNRLHSIAPTDTAPDRGPARRLFGTSTPPAPHLLRCRCR